MTTAAPASFTDAAPQYTQLQHQPQQSLSQSQSQQQLQSLQQSSSQPTDPAAEAFARLPRPPSLHSSRSRAALDSYYDIDCGGSGILGAGGGGGVGGGGDAYDPYGDYEYHDEVDSYHNQRSHSHSLGAYNDGDDGGECSSSGDNNDYDDGDDNGYGDDDDDDDVTSRRSLGDCSAPARPRGGSLPSRPGGSAGASPSGHGHSHGHGYGHHLAPPGHAHSGSGSSVAPIISAPLALAPGASPLAALKAGRSSASQRRLHELVVRSGLHKIREETDDDVAE